MRRFNFTFKTALGLTSIAVSSFLLNSCVDDTLDLDKGINMEVSLGGDSLAIPLGKTDTMKLGDFLSDLEGDFLDALEDGGYGITQAGTIDPVAFDIDASSLKLDDQLFEQKAEVNFGEMNLSDFKIPGFFKKDTMDMNIPNVEIGDVVPSVALDQNFTIKFSDYQLDQNKLVLDDLIKGSQNNDFLSFGATPDNNPAEVPFSLPISKETIGDLSVTVNYDISVPEGITNIYQIDLKPGAVMEITMSLDTASMALSSGTFTPEFEIDPSSLFSFNPLTPLTDGKITFSGAGDALTNFNNYKKVKTYNLDGFKNLPMAVNGNIAMSQLVSVGGSLNADGVVKVNGIKDAKNIDLVINIAIKNVTIDNMDFDVPSFKTTMSGTSSFSINNNSMPEQVAKINTIYLDKKAGSLLSNNLVITMSTENLPEMKVPDYKINNLDLTFPDNFVFSNMAGKTYSINNAVYDPNAGLVISLQLSEIDMSGVPITSGVLNWTGNITYNGEISFGGRMDSKKIGLSDPNINMKSQSDISLISADVSTNDINENLSELTLPISLDIDIADQIKSLGTINIKEGAKIRLDFTKPTLPLPLQAKGLQLKFSSLFEFKPVAGLDNNTYTIDGDIPDVIELELVALHINKDLNNGTLSLADSIQVKGGITLSAGNVNSKQIEALSGEQLICKATVSDLYIASTDLELKTLSTTYADSTVLDLPAIDVPAEIVDLDSIILKSGAEMKLEIYIDNMPNLGSNPLNTNIKIKFPELLQFNAGDVDATNTMNLTGAFVDGKIGKVLGLRGMKFDDNLQNGKLTINEKLNFDVEVSVENPEINSEELTGSPITVGVKVTIAGISFDKVYGVVNPNIDAVESGFNLADLIPEMLQGDDVVLDIANPVISLNIKSNIGIPVDAELTLKPIKDNAVIEDNLINATLNIPKVNNAAEIAETGFWIAPLADGMPVGYNHIEANISRLFKPIPDSLAFIVKPVINTGVQHFIDLSAKYSLSGDYEIKIPFTFGKDLSIKISQDIDSIDAGVGDLTVKAGQLELFGVIQNSIPLNLEATIYLMDINDNILGEPLHMNVNAGAPDGSATASNVSFKLTDLGTQLKNLWKVKLDFTATSNSTVAGTPIKKDNFIIADLKARVPGGINIDLNTNN